MTANDEAAHTYATTTPDAAGSRARLLLSGVTIFLGVYLMLLSLVASSVVFALTGMMGTGPEEVVFLASGLVFAGLVVIAGILFAPAPSGTRVIAVVAFAVIAIIHVALTLVRMTTPFGDVETSVTIGNSYFMIMLAGGIAWLLVAGARMGWLALLPVGLLIPVPFVMFMSDFDFAWVRLVMFTLCLIIGIVLLLAGLVRRARPAAPASL